MEWLRRLWSERSDELEPETDAHPSKDRPRRLEEDPDLLRRTRLRRRVLVGVALAALFAAGMVAAVFGEGGYHDLKALRQEAGELEAALAGLRLDVELLEAEIGRLEDDDPTARERIAREELGFIAPGEIDLLLPRSDDDDMEVEPEPPGP